MSDSLQGPNPEQNEYLLPNDQLATELALIDSYKQTFMGNVLATNLSTLKRFAGIAIPMYGNPTLLSDNSNPEDMSPDMTHDIGSGFVEFGSINSPGAFVKMDLQPAPKKLTQKEFDSLSQIERSIYISCEGGLAVEGKAFPLHTTKMLKDMYGLIGAKKVRDDALDEPDGAYTGSRLYKGTYMETEIYIEERWNTFVFDMGDGAEPKDSYRINYATIYGSESGEIAMHQLASADMQKLRDAGVNTFEARKDGIDKTNIGSYLENIKEINTLLGDTSVADAALSIGSSVLHDLDLNYIVAKTEDGINRNDDIASNVTDVTFDALQKAHKRRRHMRRPRNGN